VEESSAALGKTAERLPRKKSNYPALYALKKSRQFATELNHGAMADLAPYASVRHGCRSLPN